MKVLQATTVLFVLAASVSGSELATSIRSTASGEVVTNLTARARGSGMPFAGRVDQVSDLDDLVVTARGNGAFGLHRGHLPFEKVLKAFLGITHREMHIYMEDEALNLAGVCEALGFDPENLVESLTASCAAYIQQGVDNGVIAAEEVPAWTERVRAAFRERVQWDGERTL